MIDDDEIVLATKARIDAYATDHAINAAWARFANRRATRAVDSGEASLDVLAGFLRMMQEGGASSQFNVQMAQYGGLAAARLASTPPSQIEGLIAALLVRIEVAPEALTLEVRPIELRRFLEWDGQGTFVGRQADWPTSNARYAIEVPVSVIAAERWPSFTVQPRDPAVEVRPDKQLKILIRNARAAQALFDAHRDLDLVGLAQRFGRSPGYFSRLIRLNYLAPDIIAAIADGTQPPGLNRKTLASAHIPLDWTVQRRMFGFPEPSRPVTPRNLFGRGMWPSRGQDDAGGEEKDMTTDTL